MMSQLKKSLSVLLVAAIGGITSVAVYKQLEQKQESYKQETAPVKMVNYSGNNVPVNIDFTSAAERTVPAVVHVTTTFSYQPVNNGLFFDPFNFWGQQMPRQEQQSSGSGVIITDDGYIVTNNHVVENAEKVEVTLDDKRKYTARVIGRDPSTDLALIKVDGKQLPFVPYANSDDIKVGQWVLAVGNPFNLTSTVTAGIVSARGRNIHILNDKPFSIESFIQTDAAVNPGNSGGALVNTNGELVGVNAAIASNTGSYTGYSFAIPSNIVRKVTKDLLEYGKVQRGFIGVSIKDIDQKLAEEKDLKTLKGVYITGVTDGGAAEKAGIKEGDVITKVGNATVSSTNELQEQIGSLNPGDNLNITVLRGSDEKTFPITLKDNAERTASVNSATSAGVINALGAVFSDVSDKDKKQLGINGGVKISNLEAGKLRSAGIREGFIITAIDNQKIASTADLQEVLATKKGGVLMEGIYPNGMRAYYGFGL